MPIRASLHFHSTLLKAAEIKHFPDLFCRYLSENSENRNFQNHFCPVHNLFIFYSIAETYETVSATLYSFKKVSNCCLLYYSFLFRERTFCQISIIHSYPVSRFLLTSIPISTSRQSIPAWSKIFSSSASVSLTWAQASMYCSNIRLSNGTTSLIFSAIVENL